MPVPLKDRMMIHSAIEPCLQVLASGKVGIFAGRLKIDEISSATFSSIKDAGTERLRLTIPYAGHSIHWIVIFDARKPDIPPEFMIPDEDFICSLDIANLEHRLPTLFSWKKDDPRGMLTLIQEYLALYKNYQLNLLTSLEKQDIGGPSESRLQVRDYMQSLLQNGFISEDDVEVLVGRSEHDPVHIMVRLAVDVSNLPETVSNMDNISVEDRNDDVAALLITYPSTGRGTAQLFLSPKLDEILGGNKNLQIPSFSKFNFLPEYVTSVKELLAKKIDSIASSFKNRRSYLETLLNHMGRAALEFDSINSSKVSFLMEWNNFYFIVHACLPTNFPEDRPIYMFQSVYHTSNDKPISVKCMDYPYSPRWDFDTMAHRAKTFILEYIDTFQRNSVHLKQN